MNLNDCIGNYDSTSKEVAAFRKGNFHTITDLLLASPQDIAKRCKLSPVEVKKTLEKLLDAVPLIDLDRLDTFPADEIFTTGDQILDKAIGGGIRTGMIWEVVGESAAGKTQLALQLSLYVQAPSISGGLSGATCYLTTSSTLPTIRLLQIAEANRLSSVGCGLEDVNTISTPTVTVLQRVLTDTLPSFIEKRASTMKPVKLLVIDALGELFHSSGKTTTSTLVERSKDIANISASLHDLASKHRLAILVLNEVIDVFNRYSLTTEYQGDMLYDQQSRWFNTAEFFGEGSKEATLGLTWANQVNTRIMLSRTGRRKYLKVDEDAKRRHYDGPEAAPLQAAKEEQTIEPTLIRRLSILFSNVSSPTSLDYIVTESGISIIQTDVASQHPVVKNKRIDKQPDPCVSGDNVKCLALPEVKTNSGASKTTSYEDGDEFDQLWEQEFLDNFDWDALEQTLSQKIP